MGETVSSATSAGEAADFEAEDYGSAAAPPPDYVPSSPADATVLSVRVDR